MTRSSTIFPDTGSAVDKWEAGQKEQTNFKLSAKRNVLSHIRFLFVENSIASFGKCKRKLVVYNFNNQFIRANKISLVSFLVD